MMVYLDGAGPNQPGTIKVIGIGQSLRGDDAAGLAAVRLWQETYQQAGAHPEVHIELSELPGIGLLDLLEGAECAILVDAVRSSATPGTIHQLSEDQLDSFGDGSSSAHGWGVAETLALGRQLSSSSLPGKIVLIGIEAGLFEPGEALSPEVQASLPEAAFLIEQHITAANA